MAFSQSTFEKKSPCTLKEPQSVHRKGKTATINQVMTKAEEQIIRAIERWLYVLVMFTSLYCFAIEFFPNPCQYWYEKYTNANYS
jgi:hypothetical protein